MHALFRSMCIVLVLAGVSALQGRTATADPGFGIDRDSAPPGVAGDVLEPAPGAPVFGPLPLPNKVIPASSLGLPDAAEVDAISYGDDKFPPAAPWYLAFSVDPFSTGHSASPPVSPLYPNVTKEGPLGGAGDGSVHGDIYVSHRVPSAGTAVGAYPDPGPTPAPCGIHSNVQSADEDGLAPFALAAPNVGLGLVAGPLGHNLDALDLGDESVVDFASPGGDGAGGDGEPDRPVFFSVDAPTAVVLGPLPPAFGATTAADVLAWDPASGKLYNWAPAALILPALDAPGNDIDSLGVSYGSGAPIADGFGAAPGDVILFSLTAGSPALSSGALPPTACFAADVEHTGADIFAAPEPGVVKTVLDAEMMGLSTVRTGEPSNDNVDAMDVCIATAQDIDGDLLDDNCDFDDDNDGIGDMIDNCPTVENPSQKNSDSGPPPPDYLAGEIGNGMFGGLGLVDDTVPNGDRLGDACDPDNDNDGIPNDFDHDPAGDVTYDDDNDGEPAMSCLGGLDPDDDGASWDANCDGVRDGVAALFCGGPVIGGDGDKDGIPGYIEICTWGTSDDDHDSDGDRLPDCLEIIDINGDNAKTFLGDLLAYAKAVMLKPEGFGKDVDYDLNGSGKLTFLGDLLPAAILIMLPPPPASRGCGTTVPPVPVDPGPTP